MTATSAPSTLMNMTVLDLLVMGLGSSGKTTFIKTISQRTEWRNNQINAWHTGEVMVDDTLALKFMEPPAHRSFDFLWMRDLIGQVEVAGFIVLIDCAMPEHFGEALSILHTIRAHHEYTPCVIAANKQDHNDAWTSEDIRIGLSIPGDIPVLPCVAHQTTHVREVVLQLLYRIFDG